jgi:hypothetical protein
LDKQGYDVKANIDGWSRPPTIEGLVPDLRAKRGDKVILGQVVREDDLPTAENDYRLFIDFAGKDENTSFRVYLASDDGITSLYKIY